MYILGKLGRLAPTREALIRALAEQWSYAHAENCTNQWPHPGACHWPLPPELTAEDVATEAAHEASPPPWLR
jgi:hypothetical protein